MESFFLNVEVSLPDSCPFEYYRSNENTLTRKLIPLQAGGSAPSTAKRHFPRLHCHTVQHAAQSPGNITLAADGNTFDGPFVTDIFDETEMWSFHFPNSSW